jgi:hypothetical protein
VKQTEAGSTPRTSSTRRTFRTTRSWRKAQARRAGYEEVLIGHFHEEKHYEEADGIARILPAWLEERKHAEIAPDGTLTIVEEPSAARAVRRTYAQ